MSDEVSRRHIDWQGFEAAIWAIANRVATDQRPDPDVVVGVARGGLPGAVMLSHFLEVPLNIVWATHYDGEERLPEVEVQNCGLENVEDGDNVLLFDDVVDSGETLAEIVEKWEQQGVTDFNFETATIHIKPDRSYSPDYYVEETDDWIVYPWEGNL